MEENIRWLNDALEMVDQNEEGAFCESEIMLILQASITDADAKKRDAGPCYFCKRKGHSWRKCYKLRNILKQNGMQGDGPFPKDTSSFPKKNASPTNKSN